MDELALAEEEDTLLTTEVEDEAALEAEESEYAQSPFPDEPS